MNAEHDLFTIAAQPLKPARINYLRVENFRVFVKSSSKI